MSENGQVRFRLTPAQRVRRGADFRAVRETGRRLDGSWFLLTVRSRGDSLPARIGVVVSRAVGNAVARNRVKRLFREIFRRNQHEIPAGLDLVMVARRSAHGVDQTSLEKRFLKLLGKLGEDAVA